jgi:hypothetical protein
MYIHTCVYVCVCMYVGMCVCVSLQHCLHPGRLYDALSLLTNEKRIFPRNKATGA